MKEKSMSLYSQFMLVPCLILILTVVMLNSWWVLNSSQRELLRTIDDEILPLGFDLTQLSTQLTQMLSVSSDVMELKKKQSG